MGKTKTNVLTTVLLSAFLLAIFGLTPLMAQSQSEKKVKIDITITEDGETKKIVKEIIIEGDGDVNLEELLEDLDVLRDIDVTGEGDNIQIIIKKYGNGEDVDFDFDFDMDEFHEKMIRMKMEMTEKMDKMKHQGFLGVYVKSTGEDAKTKGSIVTKVITNTAAEKAGLQAGDIITKINGKSVDGHEALTEQLRSYKPGETVSIDYIRDGKKQSVDATLQTRSVQMHCMPGNFKWESDGDFDPFQGHMKMMMKTHAHKGPFLGVSPAKDYDGKGAKIGKVYDNSAARSMGLEADDVIRSVNGKSIGDFGDLKEAIGEMEQGDKIVVEFTRDGKKMKKTGELQAKSESFHFKYNYNYKCCDKDGPKCCNKSGAKAKVIIMNIEIEDVEKEDAELLRENSGIDISDKSGMRIESIEFLPNPSDGKFKLTFKPAASGKVAVRIVDMNGKTVYEEKLGTEKTRYDLVIDISGQPDGIYFLTLSQNGKQYHKKLIVQ